MRAILFVCETARWDGNPLIIVVHARMQNEIEEVEKYVANAVETNPKVESDREQPQGQHRVFVFSNLKVSEKDASTRFHSPPCSAEETCQVALDNCRHVLEE